jgi:predicted O-linked N-acetylglucosamine transferase (SPINDLY family)
VDVHRQSAAHSQRAGGREVTARADDIFRQAVAAMHAGNVDVAERSFKAILKRDPGHTGALNLLGALLTTAGRFTEAERYVRRAIERDGSSDAAFYNYGLILKALRRPDEALQSFDRALKINPSVPETWNNRGAVLNALNRYQDALVDFEKAIALNPHYAEAYFNKGKSLSLLKRLDQAASAFEKALTLKPGLAEAWVGLGNVLFELTKYDDALPAHDRALALNSNIAEGRVGRGNILLRRKRYQEALSEFDRSIALNSDLAHAWYGRASALDRLKRHEEAAEAYGRVLAINRQHPFAKGALLHQRMLCCAWEGLGELIAEIEQDILASRLAAEPFGWQAAATTPQSLRRCAELFNAERYPGKASGAVSRPAGDGRRIRIGYVSGELRNQATSHLIVGVLEHHDKSSFEVYAFDNGWNDGSEIRRRIEAAVPTIIDISQLDDQSAAAVIRDQQIDILINLNGYFGEERTGLFAERAAPIQVNYLGFPGTLGAPYMDYIIADTRVIPPGDEQFYTEKVVYLPDCYQANDDKKQIAERTFSREECGLPAEGFVFCCFNNDYKITPEMFNCWMGVLRRVDGSVLWLLEDNVSAVANLRKEAAARGVDPERLVFAKRIPLADHLARHRLAGLFLDTLPYNAHTTASDALWTGLPVLTRIGNTFPGRVAASLLQAAGLPELITSRGQSYEDFAVELALNPQKIMGLKHKLAENRRKASLFNTELFTRRIEVTYQIMYDRSRAALPTDGVRAP